MLSNPIINQLTAMKLNGMADALSEQYQDNTTHTLNFDERLSLLVDREYCLRTNRLLHSRLRQAKLHIPQATLADIAYRPERKLDQKHMAQLASGGWLEQRQNLVLTGATGTGKTYLACALAHKACLLGFKAQYWRTSRLLEELDLSKADGRYLTLIKAFARLHLIILDDWAMVKLQGQHQQLILDILDDRYQKHSTLITSQLPIAAWYEQIKDTTFADAILDRLLGQAQIIQLSGASMRRKSRDDQ
jgi:DNA replication protein DnaC